MYHQLSKVTGRLVSASHLQAPLFPITPLALQRVEAAAIKYTTAHLSSVAEGAACGTGKQKLVPGTNVPFSPVPESIRKRQDLFQKDNDQPIFLKGGAFDGILYRLTMALCILGLVGVADTIYSHSFPKKG